MIIHQIFIPMLYKNIDDNYTWKNARIFNRKCHHLKTWNKDEIMDLIRNDYPEFLDFVRTFPNDFWLCDFSRCLILHKHGGIYLDLDCKLEKTPDFSKNLGGYWIHPKRGIEPNMDFIYFKDRDLYLDFARFCIKRNSDCKMSSTWICRRYLYIVSNRSMNAFKKKHKNIEMFTGYQRGLDPKENATWLRMKEL
jgi:hypothetical protein